MVSAKYVVKSESTAKRDVIPLLWLKYLLLLYPDELLLVHAGILDLPIPDQRWIFETKKNKQYFQLVSLRCGYETWAIQKAANDSGKGPNLFGLMMLAREPFSAYLFKSNSINTLAELHIDHVIADDQKTKAVEQYLDLLKDNVQMRFRLHRSKVFHYIFMIQIL